MTDNKLADALRGGKGSLDAWLECCNEDEVRAAILALVSPTETLRDAKGDYDYALPTAEPIPISPDDLWTCPLPEHWRRAIEERGIENPKALDWIEQRARQMAKGVPND